MRIGWCVIVVLGACGRFGFDEPATSDGQVTRDQSVAAAYVDLVKGDGPRAYYRLGESSGSTAFDSSGNGNHAGVAFSGQFVHGRAGALSRDPDSAIFLAGQGNAGDATEAKIILPAVWPTWAGDFTIEVFVRPEAPPGTFANALLLCEQYLINGFRTGWNSEMELEMWSTESGATGRIFSSFKLTTGAWNHVAITRQGATVTLFLDGNVAAFGSFDYIPPGAGANCGIGAFQGLPSEGELDEVAIYDRALTATEIAAHVAAR